MNKLCSGSNLKPFLTLLACTLLITAASTANAAAVSSTGSGDWETAGTWSPSGVPGAGDDVTISAGHTITINGLAVNTIQSLVINGTLKHADNSTTEAHKIILTIGGNLTVTASGTIDVTALGYNVGQGPGLSSGSYCGGSHGGSGGLNNGETLDDRGPTYGSLTAPVNIGSGGSTAQGTSGGGAVQVSVGGTTTVEGTIVADGGSTGSPRYGGGSGGSVFITTANFGGSGSVTANGGLGINASSHGAGGGGRVAVVLTSGSTFGSVTLKADRGEGTTDKGGNLGYSSAGTVYTKTPSQTYGTLGIDNSGHGLVNGNNKMTPATRIPAGETWRVDELNLVNGGNLWVASNTTLNVDGTGYSGSSTNGHLVLDAYGTLTGGSDLTISNVSFYLVTGYMLDSITNMTFGPSAFVTHLANLTSEDYTLEIDIPGNLSVLSGGSINVDGRGYMEKQGPGAPSYQYGHGAGHGGRGGLSTYATLDSGLTYGSITAPTNIGSGGSWWSSEGGFNHGGGAIKLTVGGTTALDGDLSADGVGVSDGGNNSAMGGGSGGSLWLTTSSLTGSGTITADGGPATFVNGGGGGGGRISVMLTGSDSFASVTMQAFGGTNSAAPTREGAAGTIYRQTQSQGDGEGILLIDNSSRDSNRDTDIFPVSLTNEIANAALIVTNTGTTVLLYSDIFLREVLLYAGVDVTLGSYSMYVYSVEHNLEDVTDPTPGVTNQVDDYSHIIWVGVDSYEGTVIMFL